MSTLARINTISPPICIEQALKYSGSIPTAGPVSITDVRKTVVILFLSTDNHRFPFHTAAISVVLVAPCCEIYVTQSRMDATRHALR